MPPKLEYQLQHKPKVPEVFLECCMTNNEDRYVDADGIAEYFMEDFPNLGEELNELVLKFFTDLAENFIVDQVKDYADDYYEPSAREEALADLRREFYESHQFATE